MPFSLGFWANAAARLFSWSLQAITYTSYYAATYLPLTNASWFALRADTTTSYEYSTNGLSWSTGTLPSSKAWRVAINNGSRVVVVALSSTTGGAAYTTDGTTWTAANFSHSASVQQGIWDGTRFLVVTDLTSTGGLSYSTDGSTWTGIDVGNGGYSIGFDGSGTYVVLSATSTATHRICTSNPTVAGNWSDITLPTSAAWNTVVYGNGIWVAWRNGSASYATSPDGVTWTSRTDISRESPLQTTGKMYFANGKFYRLTADLDSSSGYAYILRQSATGTSWENAYTSNTNDLVFTRSWASSSTKIIGVGSGSSYLYGV
jgi:hypothetical protein